MASGNVPREIYITGLIVFFVCFTLLYLAIGNTLSDVNDLPKLESRNYDNHLLNDDARGLLGFIVNGVQGYSETTGLAWINYFFVIMTALIITMIILVIAHG